MKNKRTIKIIIAFAVAVLSVAVYMSGILLGTANRLNDRFYQRGNVRSGNISIIQIDEHSLDVLGPYQTWTRDYVAEAIEMLNEDQENAPAVIGVDILYIGTTSEDADAHLVDAAGISDNVVFGSYVNVGTEMSENDGSYALTNTITLYEEPFDKLRDVSSEGIVNGFYDKDGVIRHGLTSVTVPDGRVIPSFSYEICRKYGQKTGEDIAPPPLNEKGYWYIDFTDYSGGYSDSISLCDLINGDIPTDYFADGIVLIGPYAEGLMDSYTVAIDRSYDMYGVEIHANMIEAMLDGRYKTEVSKWVMALIIAVLTFAAVLLAGSGRLEGGMIYAVICVVGFPALCVFLYKRGIVLDLLYVPLFVAAVTIVNIIIHYVTATLEKKKVEGTFRRYVAPEIVDDILKQGMDTIKLGGETVDCAILFVDIRGFTTMSEKLTPEQVVAILNRYLELTSSSIFKFGGTLDKFIGDATMAIFGAPLPMEDYVFKAVCAANDMVERSHDLARELEEQFGRSVSFGVGVHCGKAVVGNIGTTRRMDYTAIGDTVNTSARLEANAPADTVYISKKVVDILQDRIECESVGNIPLKGKSEELEVFRLISINDEHPE